MKKSLLIKMLLALMEAAAQRQKIKEQLHD
jgi:hypothetical protein